MRREASRIWERLFNDGAILPICIAIYLMYLLTRPTHGGGVAAAIGAVVLVAMIFAAAKEAWRALRR